MIVFVALIMLVFIGVISAFTYGQISSNEALRKTNIEMIYKAIDTDYRSNFYNIDNSDTFLNYNTLQEYCKDRGIICNDITGEYTWRVINRNTNLYRYKEISIYDGVGNLILTYTGQPVWAEYVRAVDGMIGVFCTNLFNYNKSMSEKSGMDLNWYAKTEGSCYYDNGYNDIQVGTKTISKQISCTNGWANASNVGFDVAAGIPLQTQTGPIQVNNTNSIYSNECITAGLTGTSPPYAVAIRVWINRNYLQVCCGY